ncbi:MAG: hypothetical protein IT472_09925 [Thermomonas sp.]|uniref:hypothetical protein n=1 Tax=Thermomonas sp. TaxID=1971895 RepID=UPI0026280C07|nr:hypothetical protein [Thermomonas sp.]MCC7097482.1 hypothetical protein [Thermomonas sp.]
MRESLAHDEKPRAFLAFSAVLLSATLECDSTPWLLAKASEALGALVQLDRSPARTLRDHQKVAAAARVRQRAEQTARLSAQIESAWREYCKCGWPFDEKKPVRGGFCEIFDHAAAQQYKVSVGFVRSIRKRIQARRGGAL